jgi:xylitol oxidase
MRNWAGNYVYHARRLLEPRTLDELRETVRASRSFRVLGSRHSFNAIADTSGDHVSLARLPRVIEADAGTGRVTIDGAVRYGDLAPSLDHAGLALHNLGSLPHISVAGACATATHGSGDRLGCLSVAVTGVELVRADGELLALTRDANPDVFPGVAVSIGAMGVVTRLTLRAEPWYAVAQVVYDDLPAAAFRDGFDELTALGDSVSHFTTWRAEVLDQLWIKRRVPDGGPGPAFPDAVLAARRATGPRHPVPGMDPAACTEQDGVPGPWHARLPHFRLDHTPSAGDELQSEYLVDRRHVVAAYDALDALRDRIAPLVFVTEIRTIAADDLWLSPASGRDSAAFHFTWRPRWPEVEALLPAIESALAPFDPRPHWGKLFTLPGEVVASRYPRLADARSLAARLDPEGKLRNPFVDRYLFPSPRTRGPGD